MPIVETLTQAVQTGLAFLLIITVLVFVHELGHYWAAKACGMHVDAFAVMMGGVRKTDLTGRLPKPLISHWVLWGAGAFSAVVAFLGAMAQNQLLFVSGMVFLTFIGPVWVVTRLCALYHIPLGQGLGNLFKSWAAVALILFLGTRFQHLDAGYGLGMTLAGSIVAVLMTYYLPVMKKEEDTPQGCGQLEIDGEPVPVRFRPVWCKTNKEGTEFSLLLLPLGGFAAIKGMHPKADGSEIHVDKGFYSKSAWKRLIVLGAGPAFSLLLGIALLIPFMRFYGLDTPIAAVGSFAEESPARDAGLEIGDKIVGVNGNPVVEWYDFVEEVRFSYVPGENGGFVPIGVEVDIERDGEPIKKTIIPTVTKEPEVIQDEKGEVISEKKHVARIGVGPASVPEPLTWEDSITTAVKFPGLLAIQLARTFSNYEVAKQNIGGPQQTFQAAGQAVDKGFWGVVEMAGSLSIVLGVLNLLPFPPLDGGQMVIALVEMLRGNRRLSPNLQGALHTIGFVIVAFIMLAPFVIDAGRRSESNEAATKAKEKKPEQSASAPAEPSLELSPESN